MKDKTFGKLAKDNSEFRMSTQALSEAKGFYERLMDAEYRGRKDRNGSARSRLADDLGVNENKLIRLEYKIEEMRDVGGELYRRLQIWYRAICENNEEAAAQMRAERLQLKAKRNAANQKRSVSSVGMDPPRD